MSNEILVVYYSRSGNTRRLARELAVALDADLAEIFEPRARAGLFGFIRCAFDAWRLRFPPVEVLPDAARYRTVVLGGPIWIGRLAAPVRSYARELRTRDGALGFFCSLGGSDPRDAFDDLGALCGRAPLATLAVDASHAEPDAHRTELARFVASIGGHARTFPRAA